MLSKEEGDGRARRCRSQYKEARESRMGNSLWQGDDQRMGTSERDDAQVTPRSAATTTTSMIMSISGDPGGGEWVDQRGQTGRTVVAMQVGKRGKPSRLRSWREGEDEGRERRGEERRGEERECNSPMLILQFEIQLLSEMTAPSARDVCPLFDATARRPGVLHTLSRSGITPLPPSVRAH